MISQKWFPKSEYLDWVVQIWEISWWEICFYEINYLVDDSVLCWYLIATVPKRQSAIIACTITRAKMVGMMYFIVSFQQKWDLLYLYPYLNVFFHTCIFESWLNFWSPVKVVHCGWQRPREENSVWFSRSW